MPLVNLAWYVNYGNGTSTGYYAVTQWAATTSKVCGARVRQLAAPAAGSERIFICIASSGGTGQTGGSEPAWVLTRGAKTTDSTLTWQEATGMAALNGDLTNSPSWTNVKNTAVVLGQVIKNVAGTLVLICTTAGTAGNGAEPSWAAFTNAGATTADNTVTWTTLGTSFSAWSGPHVRLRTALAANWGAAGNLFFFGDNSAETESANLTLTFPGTITTRSYLYCADHTVAPPTSSNLKTTGVITSSSGQIICNGFAYIYGITLNGSFVGVAQSGFCQSSGSHDFIVENCVLQYNHTNTYGFTVGNATQTQGNRLVLINTPFVLSSTGFGISLLNNTFNWRNTASALQGTAVPTTLFNDIFTVRAVVLLESVDLSAAGTGKTIVGATHGVTATLIDCKLGASVAIGATPLIPGPETNAMYCDSAATNYRHERYTYTGAQTVETTIIRTGGASDGTTGISWKLVSTANSLWISPFRSMPVSLWCDTTGSHTVTIYGTTTGGGVPNNDDIWIEVEYLGDAASPQGSFVTTTKANNLAASTTTNNSSDGSTWGGGGAGNGFKMVTPSFTVNQKGYINVFIDVAKVSSTFYIDPLIVLT